MKKAILTSALAVAVAVGANAKTADQLRVYINPGHGSWTANDRPCTIIGHGAYSATNTDTLNFFESNTNLRKGFAVLEHLIDAGLVFDRTLNQTGERWQIGAARDMKNNVVMSHVKCGPYLDNNRTPGQYDALISPLQEKVDAGTATDAEIALLAEYKNLRDVVSVRYNRNLSEICAEVEANNFDMFISIHSNAATEGATSNYPLVLRRGYDQIASTSTADQALGLSIEWQTMCNDMGKAIWPYAYGNKHAQWDHYSATNMNIRGDINFYGSGSTRTGSLGSYKGYLGVLKHNTPGFLVEGYFHTYQPARHRAMNWDVCAVEGIAYARGIMDYFNLGKEKTGTIYGIVRDGHEKFSHTYYKPNPTTPDAYLPLNGATVVLKKDGRQVATYKTDDQYNGAFVFEKLAPGKYTLEVTHPDYKNGEPVEVEVKAHADVYPNIDLESTSYEPPAVVYSDFDDEVPAARYGLAENYNFTATVTDKAVEALDGAKMKRLIVKNNKLYALGHKDNNPVLVVLDANTLDVLTEVSTQGTEGTECNLADIALTADGVLIGSAKELCHFSDSQVGMDATEPEVRGDCNIYKWENDENGVPTGNPARWFSTQKSANMYKAYTGGSLAYSGTFEEGKMYLSSANWYSSGNVWANCINILDGKKSTETFANAARDNLNTVVMSQDFNYSLSPLDNGKFIVNSPNTNPSQFFFLDQDEADAKLQKQKPDGVIPADLLKAASAHEGYFKFAGKSLMVAADVDGENNVGVVLIDITKGLDNATVIGTSNTALEAVANNSATAGRSMITRDKDENIVDAYMDLYVLRDGKITKFTTQSVEQPKVRNQFAYDLKATAPAVQGETEYNVTFKLSGDVKAANVVLTPASKEAEQVVIPVENPVKGENTVVVDGKLLEEGMAYSWGVEVVNAPVAVSGLIYSDPCGVVARGGALPMTDPEYDSFGYVITHHGGISGTPGGSFSVYNPAGEKVATDLYKGHKTFGGASDTNQSNPFRGVEREGKAILATWGDGAHGLVVVDPINTEVEPFSLYAGTKESSGHFIYEGVNVGGGVAGVTVVGKGENTVLYTFSEDHEGLNGKGTTENSLVRYNIGTSWQITSAPEVVGFQSFLLNTNVDLVGYGNGLFVSQVRSAGMNASGTPCFAYISALQDDVTANSADFNDADKGGIDNSNAGIAISVDGKKLAVGLTNRIVVYDVTWNDDIDTPTLKFNHDIPTSTIGWASMRFDYAGNLHVWARDQKGYQIYNLHNDNPMVTTPAKAEYAIKGMTDGVSEIAVDNDNNGPVKFYNLNGVELNGENLVPGVYVKVQNGKATKVVVK